MGWHQRATGTLADGPLVLGDHVPPGDALTPAAFIERVREFTENDVSDALDFVYVRIDERLRRSDWAFVDAILEAVPLDLPLEVLLGFASITRAAQEHLRYATFYARVRAHLEKTEPGIVDLLLDGFEPTP